MGNMQISDLFFLNFVYWEILFDLLYVDLICLDWFNVVIDGELNCVIMLLCFDIYNKYGQFGFCVVIFGIMILVGSE